MINID